MTNQHVVPNGDGWAIKGEGNSKATKITGTKKEAVDAARTIAKNQGSELIIHGKDGKIQSKDSYSKDTYPLKVNLIKPPRTSSGFIFYEVKSHISLSSEFHSTNMSCESQ